MSIHSVDICFFYTLYYSYLVSCYTLIKDELIGLFEGTFKHEESLYLTCNGKHLFSLQMFKDIILCILSEIFCYVLSYLLATNYIKFGTKLQKQIVGVPTWTNCAPHFADLFKFCKENSSCPSRHY